jgi:hypothetical protein
MLVNTELRLRSWRVTVAYPCHYLVEGIIVEACVYSLMLLWGRGLRSQYPGSDDGGSLSLVGIIFGAIDGWWR